MNNIPKFWLKIPDRNAIAIDSFGVVRYGLDCVVTGYSGNRQVIQFGGSPKRVVPELQKIIQAIDGRTVAEVDNDKITPGVNLEEQDPLPVPPRQPSDITIDQLNGDDAHDYPIIARRFPWLVEWLPAKYLEVQPVPVARASQDAAVLLSAPQGLRGRKGEWNQSEIARRLDLPQTGGAYGKRIKEAIEEMERRAA